VTAPRHRLAQGDALCFDKPNGQRVRLRLSAADEIHAEESRKPPMIFRRTAWRPAESRKAERPSHSPGMHKPWKFLSIAVFSLLPCFAAGCGDDDEGGGISQAQRRGVGAACTRNEDCTEPGQICLAFKGGYCGVADCTADAQCPAGSACVAHDDGRNYCFLICTDKLQCNQTRPVDIESNCSANITFVGDDKTGYKACVPPSS